MQTRFDTEARIAFTQAADIARELGHREVGPGHLLAGLLANPRGTAYAALHDHGLELEATRELVATYHVDPEPESDHDHDHGSEEQHAHSARYEEDREALRAIGIDLDRVRDAVRANLGDDLADRWADRPRRYRGRSRRHHHHGQGRGRRGPRSRRDGLRFSRALRALLREARRSTPGLTGAGLLVALTRSDDPAVQAVLGTADSLDGLKAQAEQRAATG